MNRYLVFDLDGTLVDSLPGIAEGVNRALASLGRPCHTSEAVRGMIGRGAANLCAAAIGYADASLAPAEELAPMQQAFAREYAHCWQGNFTRPYPGVREMLLALAGQGARLAVLSNKPHEVTLPMVRTLFPEVPFDPIFGFTGRFPRKPDPAALRCIAEGWGVALPQLVMVGDSREDEGACGPRRGVAGLGAVSGCRRPARGLRSGDRGQTEGASGSGAGASGCKGGEIEQVCLFWDFCVIFLKDEALFQRIFCDKGADQRHRLASILRYHSSITSLSSSDALRLTAIFRRVRVRAASSGRRRRDTRLCGRRAAPSNHLSITPLFIP